MVKGAPADCEQLILGLKEPTAKALDDFKRLISPPQTAHPPRPANCTKTAQVRNQKAAPQSWWGPFAWAVLIKVYSHPELKSQKQEDAINSSKESGGRKKVLDVLGQLAWASSEVIIQQEPHLTLRPLDFDKLLCNLSNKLLEARQVVYFTRANFLAQLGGLL